MAPNSVTISTDKTNDFTLLQVHDLDSPIFQKKQEKLARFSSLFPEKVCFNLPKLNVSFEHSKHGLSVENNITGIQFNSIKSRSNKAIGESTRFHFQLEFREIHLLREAGAPVLEITKIETLVAGCEVASSMIDGIIYLDGEKDQKISSFSVIPDEFFEDMESVWKGRIKTIHINDVLTSVDKAAEALDLTVTEDFTPVVSRIKAFVSPLKILKGEISYSRDQEAVWFKGKGFIQNIWAGGPGEEPIKQLKHALDSKGKKVGEEWFTTMKMDAALSRYHEANAKAKTRVLEVLRELAAELQSHINIIVFSSTLLVITKALYAHVSEGRRRSWVFPTIVESQKLEDGKQSNKNREMKIVGLLPYWFNIAEGGAAHNTVDMKSLFLLTGPNGGGKSSLLRSICAAALLGICGLMVPAESAIIPYFDSIMLHMKSYDSPADHKSSFQVEMSELRSIMAGTSKKSLVLVDEICRGTETAKGTCIAGSIIEKRDKIGSSLIAQAADVPTLPWSGSHVKIPPESSLSSIPDEIYRAACVYTTEEAIASCQVVGYPAMIKASWGGGGKGIRKVHNDDKVRALSSQGSQSEKWSCSKLSCEAPRD